MIPCVEWLEGNGADEDKRNEGKYVGTPWSKPHAGTCLGCVFSSLLMLFDFFKKQFFT